MRVRSYIRQARGVLTFAGLTINTVIWFVPLFLLALLKLFIPIAAARRVITRWLMSLAENWINGNELILTGLGSRSWRADGIEELDRQGWYLVLANHQTWVDIVAMQTMLNRRVPFLKFFIKQELIWFPFLGLAWWAMDMPFMKRYSKSYLAKHPEKKGKDFEATRNACGKFRNTPTTVFNFVEGTRFTAEKKIKRGSKFEHLLPPRAGGVALALMSMGDMFDCILDLTLVYPKGVAQFWALCCGEFDGVVIDVRKRPVDKWMIEGNYESDREFRGRFHRWLTEVWQEKDGKFEEMLNEPTPH